MGSLPRLKIKDEIRYRKGHTNDSQNCKVCENFRKDLYSYQPKSRPKTSESRCALIGLRPTARYRVREDYTCDRQQMSEAYKREIEGMIRR